MQRVSPMEVGNSLAKMARFIRANTTMMRSMGREAIYFQTEIDLKEPMKTERNKAKDPSILAMVLNTKETLRTIKLKGLEFINGKMEGHMKVSGKTI